MLNLHKILIFLQVIVCCSDRISGYELMLAQTICRHGDRNIYKSYDGDPWGSIEYWPGGWGELTNIGKQQLYELGKYLRIRYEKLLGSDGYSSKKVYIKSTDSDRVLMSAEATLAGLFPPTGYEKWNENLNWQPIPVHTEPRDQDYTILPEKPCARFDYEMSKYMNTSEYKKIFSERKALISNLEENSCLKLNSLTSLSRFFDRLDVEQQRGYQLLPWTEDAMKSNELKYLATLYNLQLSRTTEMKKLRCGYLLKEMLDRFKDKIKLSLSPDRSLWMYFAHENTIATLLDCLGIFELHKPPYASCLFFEQYKSQTKNYVQLFYRNSTDTNIRPMNIPNCGPECSLDEWYALYEDILPTKTYDEECKLSRDEIN